MIKTGNAYQFFYTNDEGDTSFEKGIIESTNDTKITMNGKNFLKDKISDLKEIYKNLEELKDENSETIGAYHKISLGVLEPCYEIYPLGDGKTAYIQYQNGNFNTERASYLTKGIENAIKEH